MKQKRNKENAVFKEFETIVYENAARLYEAAYAKAGDAKRAEVLMEDAVFYGAKRSVDLIHKRLIVDIILERLGNGSCEISPTYELAPILDRAMARAKAWYRKKRLLTGMGIGIASVLLLVALLLPLMPRELITTSSDVILVKGASVIAGDTEHSELVNYQNVTEALSMNEKSLAAMMGMKTITEVFAAVTTPDGTPYVAVNNLETMDGSDTTVTLYRGYQGGWDPVATAPHGANIDHQNIFIPSDLYLCADRDSNVYLFNRIGTDVNIYRYDADMETFEKKQTFSFRKLSFFFTINVKFDVAVGEKGVAYIACNWAGSVKLWRYDVATDTLSVILENIELASNTPEVNMAVWNDTVYIASSNGFGQPYPMLLTVAPDGTVTSVRLSEDSQYFADIAIDGAGTVHIVSRKASEHFIVTADGTVRSAPLGWGYRVYEDTDYTRSFLGLFRGDDGNVYALEAYNDSEGGEASFLSCGVLDASDAEKNTFVNGYDMLDNYLGGYVRLNGKDIFFSTYAYHDVVRTYIVYFHLHEQNTGGNT